MFPRIRVGRGSGVRCRSRSHRLSGQTQRGSLLSGGVFHQYIDDDYGVRSAPLTVIAAEFQQLPDDKSGRSHVKKR